MSEKMQFLPKREILTLEETAEIAFAFTTLGVDKIRITGGEPLVRHNIIRLFESLGKLPLGELVLTTNGSRLSQFAEPLRQSGVSRINISLDSLKPERFKRITRFGNLNNVLNGIDSALRHPFERLKINSVIMKNRNHDETPDLVQFAIDRNMDISFIEEMPLGAIDDHKRRESYYSSDELVSDLSLHYDLLPSSTTTGGPSRYYQVRGTNTHVGLISPHSHNFCDTCNRVRLTAQGRLLLCLGQENSVDLRRIVRNHPGDLELMRQQIRQAMHIKPRGHDFDLDEKPVILRHMSVTGG
jgi:cyclic pyranopterin phosphate synthase